MTMLHRNDGCWRARGLRFLDYHVFEGEPHETDYRSVSDCWPKNRRKRNTDPEGRFQSRHLQADRRLHRWRTVRLGQSSLRACLENRHIMFEGFIGFEDGT